jgi:hypothetical protein
VRQYFDGARPSARPTLATSHGAGSLRCALSCSDAHFSAAQVFLIVVFCELCGNRNLETQWFAVQIGQYAFMRKHVKAFAKGGNVTHGIFTGPGEMMVLYILIGALPHH